MEGGESGTGGRRRVRPFATKGGGGGGGGKKGGDGGGRLLFGEA